VGEKGGAVAVLESLENLAYAFGGHPVAPSICGIGRRAACSASSAVRDETITAEASSRNN
jgi:hypothetical protein